MDMTIRLKNLSSEEFAKALALIGELGDKVDSWEGGTPKKDPLRPRSMKYVNDLAVALHDAGYDKSIEVGQPITGAMTHTEVDPDAKKPSEDIPFDPWINKQY